MAENDEEAYNSLLAYYRSKIGEFDRERMEWLSKFEEVGGMVYDGVAADPVRGEA